MYYFYTILYILYNFIQFGLSQIINTRENINVLLNEGTILHINFTDLERNDYTTCGDSGHCESHGKPKLDLQCNIVNEIQGNVLKQYINATSMTEVSADYAGNWQCTFVLLYKTENGKINHDVKNYSVTFKVPIVKFEEITDSKWIYIGSSIFVLAVLIIIIQTVCILHFKRKARRRKRLESLQSTASVDLHEKTVRYTKMPGQIKMEQLNKESRESVIYEALETFPIAKPEPPPIDTLPPASLERIKARKPQPLPMDDPATYEVMTPPGTIKKSESGLSRALAGKTQLPTLAVPVFPAGNNGPVLPSMIAAAQLKAAPPVFRKPPAPLPIQPIPVDNGSISSDEEEWTYEPLSQYNQYNIYDNVPR